MAGLKLCNNQMNNSKPESAHYQNYHLCYVLSKNEGTHLDSHVNMVVCCKHCHILSRSGINTTVSAFTDDVGTMQIVIIDAVIAYDCPDTTKV